MIDLSPQVEQRCSSFQCGSGHRPLTLNLLLQVRILVIRHLTQSYHLTRLRVFMNNPSHVHARGTRHILAPATVALD
jgi:hypothetical protein